MSENGLAVEVKGLSVHFGTFKAVDDISFTVARGEIFGLLGANGAGKTTTIRVMCGLLVPTSGTVRVAGLGFEDGGRAIKGKVGYMSQKFTLYDDLTAEENLAFAAALRKIGPEELKTRTRDLFGFVGFQHPVTALVRDLPGGLKQRLSLVASLLHDPEIVFLDEATAGVAPEARARFWDLIRKLSESGKTVIVTTHYMDEAENCGRLALMRDGKIIAMDSPERLKGSVFREPLYEVEPEPDAPADFPELLRAEGIGEIHPYGLRYHVAVSDPGAWERFQSDFKGRFTHRPIKPSLEDVFIRLVEGGARG